MTIKNWIRDVRLVFKMAFSKKPCPPLISNYSQRLFSFSSQVCESCGELTYRNPEDPLFVKEGEVLCERCFLEAISCVHCRWYTCSDNFCERHHVRLLVGYNGTPLYNPFCEGDDWELQR